MKVMVIMKGDVAPDQHPTVEIFRAMGDFNRRLAEAGVLVGVNGLHGSFDARRVTLAADGVHVVDGPFAETKELLTGFWILAVDSFDEAIEWMQQSPLNGTGLEVELRHVGEPASFDPSYFSPDMLEFGEETLRLMLRNLQQYEARSAVRYRAQAHDVAAIADR